MRLLVFGDSAWTDEYMIFTALKLLGEMAAAKGDPVEIVIHGNDPGAASITAREAATMSIPTIAFPTMWRAGISARAKRDRQMIRDGKPTHALAFHHDIGVSYRTADTLKLTRLAGLPSILVSGPMDMMKIARWEWESSPLA